MLFSTPSIGGDEGFAPLADGEEEERVRAFLDRGRRLSDDRKPKRDSGRGHDIGE